MGSSPAPAYTPTSPALYLCLCASPSQDKAGQRCVSLPVPSWAIFTGHLGLSGRPSTLGTHTPHAPVGPEL
jgi:hypothetical protein